MGTSRHRRGSPIYTRWALKWRGDGQLIGQCFWATKCDKLSETCLCRIGHKHVPRTFPDQLGRLTAYAVQVRYPGEDPAPDEAREAFEIAQNVRRWARAVLRPSSRQP